jgi:hypothetical protein
MQLNKPKVLRVVISTNRVDYLKETFEACKRIDYSNLDMHHLLIDDFPKDRNNKEFETFVLNNGFDEVILNPVNLGIARQWERIFEIVNKDNYDYVFMHEDDVKIQVDLKLSDLITLLKENPKLSQVQLKRNNWYTHETEPVGKQDTDVIMGDFRVETDSVYFWSLMSVWPGTVAKESIVEDHGYLLCESVIAWHLKHKYGTYTGVLKTSNGNIMVAHIGDYTHGKKSEPGVPGYDANVHNVNIETKFNSRLPYTKYEK